MALECSLAVDAGTDIAFTLSVANGASDPVELTFRDGLKADFAVLDGGTEQWRFSDDRMFVQAIETVRLAPGESLRLDGEWADHDLAPGEYEAVGSLRAERDCEARATFSV